MYQESWQVPEILTKIVPDYYQLIYAKGEKNNMNQILVLLSFVMDFNNAPPSPVTTAKAKQKHCVTQTFSYKARNTFLKS